VKEVSSIALLTEHFKIAPLSDVDGGPERKGEKTNQQRPVYQQDVFTVSRGPSCYQRFVNGFVQGRLCNLRYCYRHLAVRDLC